MQNCRYRTVSLRDDPELCAVDGVIHRQKPRARDFLARFLASLVFIEHDNDFAVRIDVSANQLLLCGRKGTAHESNHALHAMLPEFHAIEESFDNDERTVGGLLDNPVEVEYF